MSSPGRKVGRKVTADGHELDDLAVPNEHLADLERKVESARQSVERTFT